MACGFTELAVMRTTQQSGQQNRTENICTVYERDDISEQQLDEQVDKDNPSANV